MKEIKATLSYQVRFNGQIVLDTPFRGEAEDKFNALVSWHPECECALLAGHDSEGDEIKLEAYSG